MEMRTPSYWIVILSITLGVVIESVHGVDECQVNGVPKACNLHLNQFTLAGTHNSGSGAFGTLYYWSNIAALGCFYQNQFKSITQQLELGIRYFDFDISYINKYYSDWWEKGAVLVHCNGGDCAFSRSLRRALLEIEAFMGINRNEVVLIRFKDYPDYAEEDLRKHLANEILDIFGSSSAVRINPNRNPLLKDAIENNERLLIHTNGGLRMSTPFKRLSQLESYNGAKGTFRCFTADEIMDVFNEQKPRLFNSYDAVQVDWYYSAGLCLWDLAGLCDGDMFYRLKEVNEKVKSVANRPINLILIDYAGAGDVRLSKVVEDINKENVKSFSYGRW